MESLSPSATNKHWEHHKMNQTESFTVIWLVNKRNLSSVQKPSELSVLPGFHFSHTLGYFENAVARKITDLRLAFFFTGIMHCSHKRLICRQWKMNMDAFTNVYWSLEWITGNLRSRKHEWRRDGGTEVCLMSHHKLEVTWVTPTSVILRLLTEFATVD